MDLDIFAGLPAFEQTIAGRRYKFSELSLQALAELQAWIRTNTPNPLEAVKPHLAGLAAEDRAALLEAARRDALGWPPKVGTQSGAAALLGDEPGQIESLYHALRVHQPEMTREQARRLYRHLTREGLAWDAKEARRLEALAAEDSAAGRPPAVRQPREYLVIQWILATAFGMPRPDEDLEGEGGGTDPKAD